MPQDILLKIDGIDGESNQKGHEKWIELLSVNFGVTQRGSAGSGSGAGTAKADFQDVSFCITQGVSSTKLFLHCATGQHIPKAELHLRKAGSEQQIYTKMLFYELVISGYGFGAHEGIPTENISFNFTKVEFMYKPQNADGSLGSEMKAGYDIKKGAKV